MATIEATLIGDWAEAYPGRGQLTLIMIVHLDGDGPVKDMRLRVEGVTKPLAWAGCYYGGRVMSRPDHLAAPNNVSCVFQGQGKHAPSYHAALEGKTGWTWQTWGEFELRPGVARYVMRPSKVK